jgi:murein DD-endopeptidase MepM/ murein hydrolase activator NlpD
MGLVVDESVLVEPSRPLAEPSYPDELSRPDAFEQPSRPDAAREPSRPGPAEAEPESIEVEELSVSDVDAAPPSPLAPPAPPPDQSDLLDEIEPQGMSAAQLLKVPTDPPPPPRKVPLPEQGTSTDVSADVPKERATAPSAQPASSSSAAPVSAPGVQPPSFARTGHPVRDRLLAKAARAAQVPARPLPDAEPFDKGERLPSFSALNALGDELDQIAAPKINAPIRIAGTTLSSGNLLLLGTIVGLAAVASLFTLLIQFAPRGDNGAEIPVAAAPVVQQGAAEPVDAPMPSLLPAPERKHVIGPWRIPTSGSPGQKRVEGDIGQEPFLKAIQAVGVSSGEAYRVYAALKGEKNLDRCRPRDHFIALLDRASGRVVAFEYVVNKEEIYQAREGKDGVLKGAKLDLQIKRERVQGSLILTGGSFDDAARLAHLEPTLDDVVNKALDGHTSIAQFQRGDRLRVVAQEVTVLGEFSRYAGIEALEYVPVNGKPLRIFYYPARKKYYDAQGRAPGEGGWRKPVKGAPITSKFNPNRMHPILKKRMPHTGTDFGAPMGSTVYASSYGVITKLGVYGPNGNFIGIQHDHGYETGYSHLSRFEPGLKVGDKVGRMQVIGYVGSTGRSTGPHLHFSAKKDGVFIDAESLHLDALTILPPEDRAGFAQVRTQYEELLEAVPLPPPLAEPAPAAASAAPEQDLEGSELGDGEAEPGAVLPVNAAAPAALPLVPGQQPVMPQPAMPQPAPQPQPGAPNPNLIPGAAPRPPGAAFYLSDRELMESQSGNDEGEVEQ